VVPFASLSRPFETFLAQMLFRSLKIASSPEVAAISRLRSLEGSAYCFKVLLDLKDGWPALLWEQGCCGS